ncbi:MAG: VWA domain-containing protein [Candidatus Heimdallarchaeota archaeon]|nr:VWA domain-containing protein [Candidatus Heimdallarchaeota archaeon]
MVLEKRENDGGIMKNYFRNMKRIMLVFLLASVLFFYFDNLTIEEISSTESKTVMNGSGDLLLDLQANQTSIGQNQGALATLNITNTGINPVSNITTSFNLTGEYGMFTDKYNVTQTHSFLSPGDSVLMDIELALNISGQGAADAADVCLLFDASGSMGDEIESVKSEFLAITDRLTEKIPSLRMGMIVYGWSKYSEYPASHPDNYIEFTDDFDAIYDFIDSLYAGGGTEPWGDAFWLANSWDWREAVPKLAIIVGDEDCDPGNIVGVGHSDTYYNGTQLLNVITSLKEKGVKINAILTDGYTSITENQFQWISSYTGGECVDLQALQSGEDPVDLPDLIEHWTLELVREYALNLTAMVNWTELLSEGNIDHVQETSMFIWVDLAPPSISHSTFLNLEDPNSGKLTLEIYATPKDISEISTTNLYWTKDDLEGPGEPSWNFDILELQKDNETYFGTISNLQLNQHLSYYLEAIDIAGNSGKTDIYNKTIIYECIDPGTTMEFLLQEDNSTKILSYNIPTDEVGYLWVDAKQELTVNFYPEIFIFEPVFTNGTSKIYQITSQMELTEFSVIILGNESTTKIKVKWVYEEELTQAGLMSDWYLDTTIRNRFVKVELTYPDSGYLSLINMDPQLVVMVHIFNESWEKVGVITAAESLELSTGSYYLWAEEVIREGYFYLVFDEEPYTTDDPYYSNVTEYAGFNFGIALFGLVIICLAFTKILGNKRRLLNEAKRRS